MLANGTSHARFRYCFALLLLMVAAPAMSEEAFPEIVALQEQRDAFINQFRRTGEMSADLAGQLLRNAEVTAASADGALRAHALQELATALRLTQRFEEAIVHFHEAAHLSRELGLSELEFDAWLCIARSHAYGTHDHGAAADAMLRARAVAGDEPTGKQAYEIADYTAQLQSGRGELHAALINALDAYRLAAEPVDRYYAAIGVGDVLQKFAESCDYDKLADALTAKENDPWGGCRRAVSSSSYYYGQAIQEAESLGWCFMAEQASGFLSWLQPRLMLINSKAQFDTIVDPGIFSAEEAGDVLVNESFEAGASTLADNPVLAALITEVANDEQSMDPRTLYLLGNREDIKGKKARALHFYEQAAALLAAERATLFDPRGRGTVVENRPELVRELGMRLLALDRRAAAFATFESMRASGLGSLRAAVSDGGLDDEERLLLADLVGVESRASGLRRRLVENTIAGIELEHADALLAELRQLEKRARQMRDGEESNELIGKLVSWDFHPATLADLEQAVRLSGTTVATYWVTSTNVLVWFISSRGTEVKTVFLPESVLTAKVGAVANSARREGVEFVEQEARELHTYLIKPFTQHLENGKLLIVPQGVLTVLPFEALLDGERYLVEDLELSYAPSATLALEFLEGGAIVPASVAAVVDPKIEATTGEVAGIAGLDGLTVEKLSSIQADIPQTTDFFSLAPLVHVLLHGVFTESTDPLESYLDLANPRLQRDERRLTAAGLLAADWRGTDLAVLSSCEGGRVTARVSNEIHGLSWAPLVGGAKSLLVSRWRVNAASNGRWMLDFYSALGETGSRSGAVAAAMRAVLADKPHPFYWAGPQLYGY